MKTEVNECGCMRERETLTPVLQHFSRYSISNFATFRRLLGAVDGWGGRVGMVEDPKPYADENNEAILGEQWFSLLISYFALFSVIAFIFGDKVRRKCLPLRTGWGGSEKRPTLFSDNYLQAGLFACPPNCDV